MSSDIPEEQCRYRLHRFLTAASPDDEPDEEDSDDQDSRNENDAEEDQNMNEAENGQDENSSAED